MPSLSRRNFIAFASALPVAAQAKFSISRTDDEFLDDLSRRAFRYFWEQADASTGLVLDRSRCDGSLVRGRNLEVASTALTGFYLSALCIGAKRRWRDTTEIRERVRQALRHLLLNQENVRGWYYHFTNRKSGERIWRSELSTIDTAFLLAGVITAQGYFNDDAEIVQLASALYYRVDFPWMLDTSTGRLRMGWTPEAGFLRAQWTDYDENAILTILAIGSATNPISSACWYGFRRGQMILCGYRFVGRGPIFTHQYPQAWLRLANLRDGPPFQIDYFQNSVVATYAFRELWRSLRSIYPGYSENLWGVTPSDSDIGYVIWGNPASRRDLDGTVVPCAAAGSLMFAPEICLPALRQMHSDFADLIYGPYGFADAFNPLTGWVNPDIVGLDVGIALLSAENLRSGSVWKWFNQSSDVQQAMRLIFQPC
ncbi:MAG: hypothetical protein M3Y24_03035 [Acidobacteriota bacterium]|nr:hypothetical protein [Acidobacteriota bacterium]